MLTLGLATVFATIAATPTGAALFSPPAPEAPFFGLGAEHGNVPAAKRKSDLDAQVATGVKTMRENVHWDLMETSPGKYDLSRLDAIVRDMAAHGIEMMPTIVYAPDFDTAKPAGARGGTQYPPKDPATMAAFATKLVKRYGPRGSIWCKKLGLGAMLGLTERNCIKDAYPVRTWQVWNEPDYPAWWGGKPDAYAYTDLLTTVAKAIHKADRTATVMSAGLTNRAVNSGYLGQLYDAGAATAFDALAIHPYGKSVTSVLDYIRAVRGVMNARGDGGTPIELTEYGWADGGARSDYIVKTKCQAALVYAATRRLSDLRSELGIRTIFEFYWNDQPSTKNGPWPLFAGMVRNNGTAKPVLAAFTAAVKGEPAPAGLTLAAACPANRRSIA